jgi:hypothetical protein
MATSTQAYQYSFADSWYNTGVMKKTPLIAFIVFLVVAAVSEFSDFREKSSRQDEAAPPTGDASLQKLLDSAPVKKARQDTRVLRPIDIQDPAYGSLHEKHLVLVPVRFNSFNAVTYVPEAHTEARFRENDFFSLRGTVHTSGNDGRFGETLVIDNPFERPFLVILGNDPARKLVIEPLSFEVVTDASPHEGAPFDIAVFEWTHHDPSQAHKNLLFEYYTLDLGRPKVPYTFLYCIGGTNAYSLASASGIRD